MNDLEETKKFTILKWIFFTISIIFILYSTITNRGMYEDGGFYFTILLNNISNGDYSIVFDQGHPRYLVLALQQLPTILANILFSIENKHFLMMIYSFSLFAIPFLSVFWCYKLSKRTNRLDVFLWCLFTYSTINLLYCIFSVVETLIGSIFHFILWIYLSSKMEYKRRDIPIILFLIAMMFSTYEYVIVLGIIFFIASIYYIFKEQNFKNKVTKGVIGVGSLSAAIYNIIFMFQVKGEGSEILRFLNEAKDVFIYPTTTNILFTLITFILMIIFACKKSEISKKFVIGTIIIELLALVRLLFIPEISINPIIEQHYRTLPCFVIPIIFFSFLSFDLLNTKQNKTKIYNLLCIVLICGIFQTIWQIQNTYYWNRNIQYMKNELLKTKECLYVPIEHEEISDFWNKDLRRYIWHGSYAYTSILFSNTYEQKTLLLHYDKPYSEHNDAHRNELYVLNKVKNKMVIPFGRTIDIKNKFWDLRKVAKALDIYNKENNIQTNE